MSTTLTRLFRSISLGAFAIGIATSLSACSDQATSRENTATDDGSLRGQLIESIATYDDGTSETTYQLRVGGNPQDERSLVLRETPDLFPMSEVKVWGVVRDGKIFVERLEPVGDSADGLGSTNQPLIGAPPIPPTKLAMAIVDIGLGTRDATITPEELQKRVFTNADSVRAYYLQNSYNMHDLTGKVVSTVLNFPMTTGCSTSSMATTLKPMVDADVGGASNVYLWYFQARASGCSWSGLSSGQNTYYNASAGCVVLVQEPGHSFGLAHASSMACTSNGQTVAFLDDPNNGCKHNEYGNPYDTMGGGCRHFSAYHKTYRTYTQKCNVVRVRKSGTFNLFPIEKACNGIQVLAVPMPHVRPYTNSGGGGGGERNTQLAYYTVELRSPIGFDTGLKPSVLINAAPDFRYNNTSSRNNNRGEHTWLLDMAPSVTTGRDGTAHALAVGQTFTDPAGGVAITTLSVNQDGASIKVDITGTSTVDGGTGDTVCVDNTPITAPGPTTCGDDGGGVPPPPPLDASSSRDARADSTGTGGTGGTTNAGTGGTDIGSGTAGSSNGQAGTTTSGTGGSRATAGSSNANPSEELQGGCACRVLPAAGASGGGSRQYALFTLGLAVLLARRRRTAR
ncbi:MAG TPA: hypothetical protein VF881_18730 [Polyangiaceae bacterium]